MIKMKDSGVEWIGEIPINWELNKIGSIYEERNTKVSDKDFPPLSVTKKGIVPQLENAAKTDNGDNRKLIKKNDFVINSRSDRRGSCGISEYDGSCSLINTVLKPRRNMSNKYYSYVFRSELFADEFYRWGNGIVDDLWSTKWSNMKNIYIPSPPLETQHRIADYLDEKCVKIEKIIEKQQAVIERLKEYKLSVITEAVTKGIQADFDMKESGIDWVGKMPEHWIKCRLSDVTKRIIVGLATSVTPYYRPKGIILLRNLNIKEGYLDDNELLYLDVDFAESQTGKFIHDGDVLTVHTGSNLGLSCVVPSRYANTLSFTTLITSPLKDKLMPQYLMYTINSGLGKSEIDRLKCGDIKPNLNVRQFKYFTIFLPPINEQKQIVHYLDKKCEQINTLIFKKSKEIEKLLEYKKSLIYEAVTGKKEV